MFELFAQDVMKQAFIIGLVISVIAPTIGIFFVVRRFSAIADTLAHISLAGVAISFVTHPHHLSRQVRARPPPPRVRRIKKET